MWFVVPYERVSGLRLTASADWELSESPSFGEVIDSNLESWCLLSVGDVGGLSTGSLVELGIFSWSDAMDGI
jgi:hypothetical protein